MARLYIAGAVKLGQAIASHLEIPYRKFQEVMWDEVIDVLYGDSTLDEVIERTKLVHSARQDFVGAIEEFDYEINLNPSLGFPDHEVVVDSIETVEADYSIVGLARKAWEEVCSGDYIPGVFGTSVLVGIFLSSYSESQVGSVDFSTLLPLFEPLKTSIAAMNMEEDYARYKTNSRHI